MIKEAILLALLAVSFASCRDCTLAVRNLLNNKKPIDKSHWTNVQVSCNGQDNPTLMIMCPHKRAVIKIYFANEKKNILVANMVGTNVRGSKYRTPHGKFHVATGPDITREGSKFVVEIPREWLPKNLTRMSASVEVNDTIQNYYGIFNYGFSIPDTMVVEQYKKLNCCLAEL